jgi:type II secretory pathway pseudopilin PulG
MTSGPGSKVQSCHVPSCSRPKGSTRTGPWTPESRADACGDVAGMDFGAWSGRRAWAGRRARRRVRGGFTLMEVIVGLLVASLTLTAGFATLAFVSERSQEAELATAAALQGAAGRTLLVEWLSSARLSSPYRGDLRRFLQAVRGVDEVLSSIRSRDRSGDREEAEVTAMWQGRFAGLEAEENALESDELVFPTTARTPLHVPNSMVRLYVDTDETTPERGLVAELTERPLDIPRRAELVPGVARMEIRYLPDVEGTVDDLEWVDGWNASNNLPKAVEITLFAAQGDSLPALLRYPIRVPLGTLR